jgi:hypothetical protein
MSISGGEAGARKSQPFFRKLQPRVCIDWITGLYRPILAIVG